MGRGLLVWLLIILVETVHGVLRGLLLVPRVGEDWASRIGWPVGIVIVLAISFLTIRWTRLRESKQLLTLGAIWAVLTLGFEIGIGLLRGFDGPRLFAEVNPFQGGLMLYSAAIMFIAPVLAARVRGLR